LEISVGRAVARFATIGWGLISDTSPSVDAWSLTVELQLRHDLCPAAAEVSVQGRGHRKDKLLK
jgi:hypothetical protein